MSEFASEIRRRLADLRLPPGRESEIVEELSQHLEDESERLLPACANEAEARARALRQLDESDLLASELARSQAVSAAELAPPGRAGGGSWWSDLGQDLRYGLRMLLRAPGFTTVAVLALALGVGANSAIFSVVNAVLLQPLPYRDPAALMIVWEDATHHGFPDNTPSPANFLDWREQNTVFEGLAAMASQNFNLTGSGDPERCDGRRVSANLFSVLGVEPVVGRNFLPEEDRPGSRVVLLSHGLWQRRAARVDPMVALRNQ